MSQNNARFTKRKAFRKGYISVDLEVVKWEFASPLRFDANLCTLSVWNSSCFWSSLFIARARGRNVQSRLLCPIVSTTSSRRGRVTLLLRRRSGAGVGWLVKKGCGGESDRHCGWVGDGLEE